MERNTKHREQTWSIKTKIENETFENYDFKGTDFNHPIFIKVNFINCVFEKTQFQDARLYNCDFDSCTFVNTDLRNATLGSKGGVFKNCIFKKCDFKGKDFDCPHFLDTVFEDCKLKKINFNDSSFDNCKFIGKMEDVTFNGIYHYNKSSYKPINKVDFSEAIFGDFVGFEKCDLSNSIPPKGNTFEDMLYVVDLNDPNHKSTGTKDRIVIK